MLAILIRQWLVHRFPLVALAGVVINLAVSVCPEFFTSPSTAHQTIDMRPSILVGNPRPGATAGSHQVVWTHTTAQAAEIMVKAAPAHVIMDFGGHAQICSIRIGPDMLEVGKKSDL